eukprot:GFYU01019159.1.p1 GENE.GFYU01019159.1~~GFYU01019159.1.p1  ORF type:complete len:204 (+),score=11.40 GFYU01019159.1:58-669(+)
MMMSQYHRLGVTVRDILVVLGAVVFVSLVFVGAPVASLDLQSASNGRHQLQTEDPHTEMTEMLMALQEHPDKAEYLVTAAIVELSRLDPGHEACHIYEDMQTLVLSLSMTHTASRNDFVLDCMSEIPYLSPFLNLLRHPSYFPGKLLVKVMHAREVCEFAFSAGLTHRGEKSRFSNRAEIYRAVIRSLQPHGRDECVWGPLFE